MYYKRITLNGDITGQGSLEPRPCLACFWLPVDALVKDFAGNNMPSAEVHGS